MRISWLVVISVALAVGTSRGQEASAPPLPSDFDPPRIGAARPVESPSASRKTSRWREARPDWWPLRWSFAKRKPDGKPSEVIATAFQTEPGLNETPLPPPGGAFGAPASALAPAPANGGGMTANSAGAAANPGEGAPTTTPGAPGDSQVGSQPTPSNPAAVSITAGTGALGRFLGIPDSSGLRIGGLWLGDASGVLSGGRKPGGWGLNSLTIMDVGFDAEEAWGWKGSSFDIQFLQLTGQETNSLAGAFPGFNSIPGSPPLVRQQLYQLWYRQSLFDDKLIFRIGKSVPTYDFGNVVRPVPVNDTAAAIPAVTGLIWTPVFVNPTMLGAIPGYYNSATGITTTFAPNESLYFNYGFYDGNLANQRQTGLEGPHFNGYYFHIGEVGFAYRLGEQKKPGNFGVGVWGQTGVLKKFTGGTQDGADGVYLFGSQRLWFRHPGKDNSGISGFYQYGANNTDALLARQYVGGGLTAFGLTPGRPDDSFGAGISFTGLTRGEGITPIFFPAATHPMQLRPSQLMVAIYYQMKVIDGIFFQTTLTDIPTPGENVSIPNAFTIDFRVITLF